MLELKPRPTLRPSAAYAAAPKSLVPASIAPNPHPNTPAKLRQGLSECSALLVEARELLEWAETLLNQVEGCSSDCQSAQILNPAWRANLSIWESRVRGS